MPKTDKEIVIGNIVIERKIIVSMTSSKINLSTTVYFKV